MLIKIFLGNFKTKVLNLFLIRIFVLKSFCDVRIVFLNKKLYLNKKKSDTIISKNKINKNSH